MIMIINTLNRLHWGGPQITSILSWVEVMYGICHTISTRCLTINKPWHVMIRPTPACEVVQSCQSQATCQLFCPPNHDLLLALTDRVVLPTFVSVPELKLTTTSLQLAARAPSETDILYWVTMQLLWQIEENIFNTQIYTFNFSKLPVCYYYY